MADGRRLEIIVAGKRQGTKEMVQRKITIERWQAEPILYRTIKHTDRDSMQKRDAARHALVAQVSAQVEAVLIELLKETDDE